MGALKFEAALTRLEELVRNMEKGDLSLEESLKLFEEGVRLSGHCTKILNEAEKKVATLMMNKEGKTEQPLDITAVRPDPSESDEGLDE